MSVGSFVASPISVDLSCSVVSHAAGGAGQPVRSSSVATVDVAGVWALAAMEALPDEGGARRARVAVSDARSIKALLRRGTGPKGSRIRVSTLH